LAGTGFFIGQQLLWDQQRIAVKFSAHTTRFAQQRPDLLGEGLAERILKDYNGQTIWLSANIDRFAPSEVPQWLNLAFGYSATGIAHMTPLLRRLPSTKNDHCPSAGTAAGPFRLRAHAAVFHFT